jgi:Rps23 Pro-64 3,4-dihydroxylase Tpa1-like proline 4-hydroxylase
VNRIFWRGADPLKSPFPHLRIPDAISLNDADTVLTWLEQKAPWALRVEDFYQQHEFSLLSVQLDDVMKWLVSDQFVGEVHKVISDSFQLKRELTLVDVNAHRLGPGQVIRIHNDYIESAETHRFLIQLNRGWNVQQGGLLMLFGNDEVSTLHDVILPTHRGGFAFEISPHSFHAVSEIKHGHRYTLVYTFK